MQGESDFKNKLPDPVKTSDVYAYQTVKQLRQIIDMLNDMTKLLAFVVPKESIKETIPETKAEVKETSVKKVSRKKKEVK